jgi:hypothetical protein
MEAEMFPTVPLCIQTDGNKPRIAGHDMREKVGESTDRLGRLGNLLDPELMSAKERIEEVASLLARGFLRARLRAAEKCQNGLAILRTSSHECPKWLGGLCPPPWRPKAQPPESVGESL